MDELLINASLRQREPSSLPWNTAVEEKNKDAKSVDKTTTSVDGGIFDDVEDKSLKFKDLVETSERKSTTESRYGGLDTKYNLQNVERSNQEAGYSPVDSKYRRKGLVFVANGLSNKDVTCSSSEYSRKISVLNTINVKENQGINPASTCLSECHTIIQRERTKSPRSSVRVSPNMIQDSKHGISVHLQSAMILSDSKDKMSNGVGSTLKNGDNFANKQIEQRQAFNNLKRKSCFAKSLDDTVPAVKVNLKRKNDGIAYKNSDKCNQLDVDVDNELDDLLELTADAITHESKRNVEREKPTNGTEDSNLAQSRDECNSHWDNETVNSKDYKGQDGSVLKNLSSGQELDDVKNLIINGGNVMISGSTSLKKVDKTNIGKDVNSCEFTSYKQVGVVSHYNDTQRSRYERVQVKDFAKRKDIKEIRDIISNMDVIDGIGIKTSEKTAQDSKKSKAKDFKKERKNERKRGDVGQETNAKTREERRVRRRGRKDVKAEEKIPMGETLRDRHGTTRKLNRDDTEDDVYDISPVKNRERLSDSDNDNENDCSKYGRLRSNLLKRDQASGEAEAMKMTKDYNVNTGRDTGVISEQPHTVPLKSKQKRSKKEKKGNVATIKMANDMEQIGEQLSHQKKTRMKLKKACKTFVKDGLLQTDESTRINKSGHNELKRAPVKTRDEVPKSQTSNPLVQRIDKNMHDVCDDQTDKSKSGHRLKSSKSYTITKHKRNAKPRTDKRGDIERYNDKGTRRSDNLQLHKAINRVNVEDRTEENILKKDEFLKVNEEKYKKGSTHTKKSSVEVETTATPMPTAEKRYNQEFTDNFPDVELGDLMYDSGTDTDKISDIQYQSYVLDKPPSDTSSDFEFPRPASNRTFVIDSESGGEEGSVSIQEDTNKKEKKISRAQKIVNFFMCCFRPKTND